MDETATLTVRLPKAYVDQLSALAASTKRSKSSLAGEALEVYLTAWEWQVVAISEGVDAVNAGANPIQHSEVASWLRSWGTENELPPPR